MTLKEGILSLSFLIFRLASLDARCLAWMFFFLITGQRMACCQSTALPTAFAHNDYRHKHPFYDALTNGFTHLEADIFRHNDRLLVLHRFPFFKGQRTLEKLYLEPLHEYIRSRENSPQTALDTLVLMIDVKTNGEKTVSMLKELLSRYEPILTYYQDGNIVRRNLTIVLSGNRPMSLLRNEQTPFLFVDENLRKVNSDAAFNNRYTMASCRYKKLLRWKGKGPMPEKDKKRLCDLVEKAHQFGKKVRLWAAPEKESVWLALLECGVDLINTDKLEAFRHFAADQKQSSSPADSYELWLQ